jgi:hypothetical protein
VTGLKPGHFYNVRVIAVGSNNFQAGSGVIRLRTYGRDGRPHLANGRVPSSLSLEDQQNGALAESSDESPAVLSQVGIETAASPVGSQPTPRDPGQAGHTAQRRNTLNRKHSPSNAAADQAAQAAKLSKQHPEASMQQLTEKFENIRKETEEVMSQASKDAEDFKVQLQDLAKEREEKKQILKEKEEASEKLKKEVHYSERANRQAQNRKSQKDKALREKQAERTKMQEDMVRWKREIEDMKNERKTWETEKEKRTKAKGVKTQHLREAITERQSTLVGLEEDIRVKGLQIKELEEERKSLPGAQDDDESRERAAIDEQLDLEWDIKERQLATELHKQAMLLRRLQAEFHGQQAQYSVLTARYASNPIMNHANSSGVDFESTSVQGKVKSRRSRHRKSRTNTVSSPSSEYAITNSQFPSTTAFTTNSISPGFAMGPYFDLRNDTAMVPLSEQTLGMSEADIRALTAGAPLSPTATSLLPSNIFADDDPPSPSPRAGSTGSFGPALYGAGYDIEVQSPISSSRSPSLLSSPQTSSNNLALYGVSSGPDYGTAENDHKSLNSPRGTFGAIGSSGVPSQPPIHKGFGSIFNFPRARGKTMEDDGPALGTLKQGQSQSFPRSTDEPEVSHRSRRMSISSGSWVPNLFTRSSAGDATEGNAPAPARNAGTRRRRNFNIFGAGSSLDDGTSAMFSDRDPSSPRPLSIASSDLPRPSTDSAPFGWTVTGEQINRNSPLATNWSINVPQTSWSRNPSRRPSLQHGSTTALASGVASDDDEFLPSDILTGPSSPPPVGVIGTRPPSSHRPPTLMLNPAAPTFTAMLSNTFKGKGKGKEKATEVSIGNEPPSANLSSPTDSRKSRDTPSIHTQNSMAESYESLEMTSSSNAPSEVAASIPKESSIRQLLRKGSSSKFSLSSIRHKDSGLFGKKGAGSSASGERDGSFDEAGEDGLGRPDSVTSSPMIGAGEWKGKERDSVTSKEGRINWSRFALKKDKLKARESLDALDRSEAETTGTEDEA